MVPLEGYGGVTSGVDDVEDVNFGGDGEMEAGDAQILQASGVGAMAIKGKEGAVKIKVSSIDVEGNHITRGGGYTPYHTLGRPQLRCPWSS